MVIALAVMYAGFLVHFWLHEDLLPKALDGPGGFRFPNALLFVYNLSCMLAGFTAVLVTGTRITVSPYPFI